jgi:hypothetical protein
VSQGEDQDRRRHCTQMVDDAGIEIGAHRLSPGGTRPSDGRLGHAYLNVATRPAPLGHHGELLPQGDVLEKELSSYDGKSERQSAMARREDHAETTSGRSRRTKKVSR